MFITGFMRPFGGMPIWAQRIDEILPLTHFLRLMRGILMKGKGILETLPHLWPLALFMFVMILFGLKRFKRTLDSRYWLRTSNPRGGTPLIHCSNMRT